MDELQRKIAAVNKLDKKVNQINENFRDQVPLGRKVRNSDRILASTPTIRCSLASDNLSVVMGKGALGERQLSGVRCKESPS